MTAEREGGVAPLAGAPPGYLRTDDETAGGATRRIERRFGDWARRRLHGRVGEFAMFVLKQGWAALFGILLLTAMILTGLLWRPGWPVARMDALLAFAVAVQVAFLALRLETPAEARVILAFHVTGTVMELFKVAAGSWHYPGAGFATIAGVPLFSGFMYAAVGSYMARVIRIFRMRFERYPPLWLTAMMAGAIYVNFFAHHWLPDARWLLMAGTVAVWGRCVIRYRVRRWHAMPLVLAALLSAAALWLAEQVGTRTGAWLYAGTPGGVVSLAKLGSWYLLLYVAFVTVTLAAPGVLRQR